MSIIGPLVGLFVLVGGWFVTKDFWLKSVELTRIYIPIGSSLLIAACYFVSVAMRLRRTHLEIGRLKPDEANDSNLFQIRVKNLGPGDVKPIVKVTYLRDGKGRHLGPASYGPTEVYWRHTDVRNQRPSLAVNDEAYATILWITKLDTETPTPTLHAISTEPIELWQDARPLEDQLGLRLKITVSYEGRGRGYSPFVLERSYKVIPDREAKLKYKVKRVWIQPLFWP